MLAQPIKITVTVHNLNRLDEPVFIAVSKPLLTELTSQLFERLRSLLGRATVGTLSGNFR